MKKRKFLKKFAAVLAAVNISLLLASSAFAQGGSFASSSFATGVSRLIGDILAWLTPLAVTIGAIFIAYFAIRRGQADESEKKRWENRIVSAIICTIIASLATSFLSMFMGYFN